MYHVLWSNGSFSVGSFESEESASIAAHFAAQHHPIVKDHSFMILTTEQKKKFTENFKKNY